MECITAKHLWIITPLLMTTLGCVEHYQPRIVDRGDSYTLPSPTPEIPTKEHGFEGPWIPQVYSERAWQAIVIHHSATASGNAAIFDRWHREENHWNGVGYNFVIGNGTDSGDGQVEVTHRWQQQLVGAHCRTPKNWANEHAIGICLVGDFSQDRPTAAQMKSLVQLVRFLQQRYGIPTSAIYGHGDTPGARVTACPGHLFPWDQLRRSLLGN